jgi:hypothetical protein
MKIKICSANIIREKRKNFQNLEEFENLIKEKLILLLSPTVIKQG